MGVLLTEEEISGVFVEQNTKLGKFRPIERQRNQTEAIGLYNKAQLKKVVKWGDSYCVNTEHDCGDERTNTRKRECRKCWQSLLKEAE